MRSGVRQKVAALCARLRLDYTLREHFKGERYSLQLRGPVDEVSRARHLLLRLGWHTSGPDSLTLDPDQ